LLLLIDCDWYVLQQSADLVKELHGVVSGHADSIELQQSEISQLDSEFAELTQKYASVEKERDEAEHEIKCLQMQNKKQLAQFNFDV